VPQSPSVDDDDPEQQIRLEFEGAIKQEDQDHQLTFSFSIRDDDYDYEVARDSSEEPAEAEEFGGSLPSHGANSTKCGLGDMDEPIQSIEVDDDVSDNSSVSPDLRGGTSPTQHRHSSEDNEDEDGDSNESESVYLFPPINLDEYYESEDDFQDDYDVDSQSLDWYRLERTRVAGIKDWPMDAAQAHKLMALCGYYSLFPNSWKCDLVDHPYLSGLFSPEKDKKTLIRAESNQFRGLWFCAAFLFFLPFWFFSFLLFMSVWNCRS
jgi:hypothetical protein